MYYCQQYHTSPSVSHRSYKQRQQFVTYSGGKKNSDLLIRTPETYI